MADDAIQCWDYFKCGQERCPAFKQEDSVCWLVSGTCCRDEIQGQFIEKMAMCLSCAVFSKKVDTFNMAATCEFMKRQFDEFRCMIEDRDREMEEISLELAVGLSEVFEALQKIGTGDPSVRIPEESKIELIQKVKQQVNSTAKNLGEIVDLSHEFAIGLAEHFDVLNRVSSGDLGARVKGGSEVELLEMLKTVTNQMIESVSREIDDRRKTETELRESEIRFRTFVEEAPFGITIMRPDKTFEYINPMFTKLFGYTIEDVPDKENWFEKAYPEKTYRDYVVAMWRYKYGAQPKSKAIRRELLSVYTKEGKEKKIRFQTVVLPSGGHIVTYEDYTEYVKAENAIKESEEKYRTLIDNIQDGVFIHQGGTIKFVNDALARMIGYSTDELIGKSIQVAIAPEDWLMVKENYIGRLGNKEMPREYEFRMIHKDGVSRVLVRVNVSLFSYLNEPAFIGTVKDITQQKRDEIEKKKLEAQLQRSQKMEALGTLAGGVAHDLNNILSGIVSYPELILMDLPQNSPLRKPIMIIQQAGERAAAIVHDLLTLARRAVPSKEIVNLNHIIKGFLKSPEFDRILTFHPGVQLETDLVPDLFNISGSPVHLSKTVMNLISNAAEAMPDGGTIRLSTANQYIDRPIRGYDAVKEGDYITVTVADSGVGISREDLERIFEPFYTKKIMGRSGTGLGMAVVWGTVKDHNGYIDVISAENHGATFTLYFPVTREIPRETIKPLSLSDYLGAAETILVVDDVVEQREIATAILTKLGYIVHSAASGEEAVEYFKSRKADLVLLDMIMDPGIDGLETYRRILEVSPGQKAIVASGFSMSGRVREIQQLGAGAYVKKPYSLENIAVAIRNELKKK